jgi:hypothetical protein
MLCVSRLTTAQPTVRSPSPNSVQSQSTIRTQDEVDEAAFSLLNLRQISNVEIPREQMIKSHFLFQPLKRVLQQTAKLSGSVIPEIMSQLSHSCDLVMDKLAPLIGSLDVDEVLLMEEQTESKSKKKLKMKKSILPDVVDHDISKMQKQMEDLIEQIEDTRPLLENERSSRIQAIRFPTRIVAAATKQDRVQLKAIAKKKKENKKRTLPENAILLMKDWLDAHIQDPYPSLEEKKKFSIEGNITLQQVDYWFVNMRSRVLHKSRRKRKTPTKLNQKAD